MGFVCPVCGFPNLDKPPRSPRTGGGSFEICPSCSFHFGVSDDDLGFTFEQWRQDWIAQGMPWDRGTTLSPEGWDPRSQLRAIGVALDERGPATT
jgi:hypothetical protein